MRQLIYHLGFHNVIVRIVFIDEAAEKLVVFSAIISINIAYKITGLNKKN